LARLPGIGEHLTFKGGTSLSKAWNLIQRFSEDIDLIVDKQLLGFAGAASPDRASSRKQRKRRLDGLVDASRNWVQGQLQPALATELSERLGPSADWSFGVDPDAEDGQCLLFRYPGLFSRAEAGYVRPVVKLELGARSDDWPAEPCLVTAYVAETFPQMVPEGAFPVRTLAAERTFWEKAMLLHEETFRPEDRPRNPRLARHYYDLWCLISRGVAERAVADRDLFRRVAEHREAFFHISWVDYATLRPGSLRLLPPPRRRDAWRRDYEQMRGPMFFGEIPSFEEILRVVGDFERQFNETATASRGP
jgi:predicted nucleotidyltransferase component of viral defense system